jgi:RNA-binding protein
MTGKERAAFRAQANTLEPEFQIGKGGMSESLIKQTLDSFRTKELIKIKVLLDSAPESPREFANKLSEATDSEVIQVIGGVIVLYKQNPDLGKEKKKAKAPKKSKPLSNVKAKRAIAEKKEAEKKKSKRDFYAKKRDYSSKQSKKY